MASFLYNEFKSALLTGQVDMLTDTIVAYLVNSAEYTASADDEGLAAVPVPARVSGPVTLTGATVSDDGDFDSADPSFPSVTGASVEAVVLYNQTAGVLVAYQEGAAPVTPNGNNINITVPALGWFRI